MVSFFLWSHFFSRRRDNHSHHFVSKCTVAFSQSIDKGNADIKKLVDFADKNEVTTGKFTIGDEKRMNVFMRLSSPAVLGTSSSLPLLHKSRGAQSNPYFWSLCRGYAGNQCCRSDGKAKRYEGESAKAPSLLPSMAVTVVGTNDLHWLINRTPPEARGES